MCFLRIVIFKQVNKYKNRLRSLGMYIELVTRLHHEIDNNEILCSCLWSDTTLCQKINITISANPFLRPYKFVQICCIHYGGHRGWRKFINYHNQGFRFPNSAQSSMLFRRKASFDLRSEISKRPFETDEQKQNGGYKNRVDVIICGYSRANKL